MYPLFKIVGTGIDVVAKICLSKCYLNTAFKIVNIQEHVTRSLKNMQLEIESFKTTLQNEMQTQVKQALDEVIQEMTNHLKNTMSTQIKELVLQTIQQHSPRQRKIRRRRIPFTPESSNDDDSDDQFQTANNLFEANLTTQPDSPSRTLTMTDDEYMTLNHHP